MDIWAKIRRWIILSFYEGGEDTVVEYYMARVKREKPCSA